MHFRLVRRTRKNNLLMWFIVHTPMTVATDKMKMQLGLFISFTYCLSSLPSLSHTHTRKIFTFYIHIHMQINPSDWNCFPLTRAQQVCTSISCVLVNVCTGMSPVHVDILMYMDYRQVVLLFIFIKQSACTSLPLAATSMSLRRNLYILSYSFKIFDCRKSTTQRYKMKEWGW